MAIKPYLQLIRLPNLFTAAADSLAGFLIVGGSLAAVRTWGPFAAASVALYAFGIVANDLCDLRVDQLERPNRPLPSGSVSLAFARRLAVALVILGVSLAALAAAASALVAIALVGCIAFYNLIAKKGPIGPFAMGSCRALNLLLGMSLVVHFGGPTAWLAAVSYGLFVAGITWISRSEAAAGNRREVVLGLTLQDLALAGLLLVILAHQSLPNPESSRARIPAEGLLVLAIVALIVNSVGGRALSDPSPASAQAAVKTGIFSLIWLNVAVVLAVRDIGPGLFLAGLWLPAFFLGKWLYAT
jgi:4-hydroxybenzoate polyprenyltransferase